MRVTQFGEPVLQEVGEPVVRFDAELKRLACDMLETMRAYDGIGIAAPQVDLSLQFFVIDFELDGGDLELRFSLDGRAVPARLLFPLICANPVLTPDRKAEIDVYEEGCLSFPGIRGEVPRPSAITLQYADLAGAQHELQAQGFLARVIQHEYDHVRGILFTDRMTPSTLQSLGPKLKRLKRETRARMRG